MLRYRIAKDPQGHYFVLPALVGIVSFEETYTSRTAACKTADWRNRAEKVSERSGTVGCRAMSYGEGRRTVENPIARTIGAGAPPC